MSLTFGALIALYVLGLGPGSWLTLQVERVHLVLSGERRVDAVLFVDGPLADAVDELAVGSDGLPPLQICAPVRRDVKEGGDYTLPYQRDVFSEHARAWLYTQGWQAVDSSGGGVDGMGAHAQAASSLFGRRRGGEHSGGRQAFIRRLTDQTRTDRADRG